MARRHMTRRRHPGQTRPAPARQAESSDSSHSSPSSPSADSAAALQRLFSLALSHHQAGRLPEAGRLYERILAADPAHARSLHLLGLVESQSGRHERACALIGKSLSIRPDAAEAHGSLGLALRMLGRLEEALAAYRRCVALRPGAVSALSALADLLKQMGRHEEALVAYRQVVQATPDDAQAHNNLGVAFTALHRHEDALAAYRRALEIRPDFAVGHFNLGVTLQALGQDVQALAAYRRAIELSPGHQGAHNNQGVLLRKLGRPSEALAVLQRALTLNPAYAEAYSNLGVTLQDLCRSEEAVIALRRAIELKPDYAEASNNLGIALTDLGRYAEAQAAFQRALELKPDYAHAHNNLSVVWQTLGRLHEAATACRRAIELEPDYASAHNNLGTALKDLGRNEEALAAYDRAASLRMPGFESPWVNKALLLMEMGQMGQAARASEQALSVNPRSGCAWHMRSELKEFVPDDPDIDSMQALLATADVQGLRMRERIDLEFALGKAWMDAGDPERAFLHLNEGNRRRRAILSYDGEATSRWLASVAQVITPALMRRFEGASDASEVPVFVVGMPRSGTSLVEQILASHPEIHGAGELSLLQEIVDGIPRLSPERLGYPQGLVTLPPTSLSSLGRAYLQRVASLAPGRRRIVDKMPANFRFAGLIHMMLPNARIIHCRRDAVDTCLSCYAKNFRSGLGFCFDQRELGRFYRDYEALMAHWRGLLPPERFTEVVYEDIVDDLEGEARRLISFCGMPWNEACLSFHRTRRPVHTVSARQVRQPLYRGSVGRWRGYVSQLRPLLDALGIRDGGARAPPVLAPKSTGSLREVP